MANIDLLDVLYSKHLSPKDFNFELLNVPPLCMYLSDEDIHNLHEIATSVKLTPYIKKKYAMIDNIMKARGFKRFSAGTNRVVYSYLEDQRFLAKIAVDRVGLQDNPLEYKNQQFLRPYVAKTFHVSKCGTVALSERVLPVKNLMEFREIASDVFDILVGKFLGEYVVQDVGTKYFMNWGIRMGFGPVLLDYPYVYVLDGKKLFCSKEDPVTRIVCNGEIDYDAGFNSLICTKCGKTYLAINLKDDSDDNKIIIQGGNKMKVKLMKGDEVIHSSDMTTTKCIERDTNSKPKRSYEDRFNFTVKTTEVAPKDQALKRNRNRIPDKVKTNTSTTKVEDGSVDKNTHSADIESMPANDTKDSGTDTAEDEISENITVYHADHSSSSSFTLQRDSKGRSLPRNPVNVIDDSQQETMPNTDDDDYEAYYDKFGKVDGSRNHRPRRERDPRDDHPIDQKRHRGGVIRKLPKV